MLAKDRGMLAKGGGMFLEQSRMSVDCDSERVDRALDCPQNVVDVIDVVAKLAYLPFASG